MPSKGRTAKLKRKKYYESHVDEEKERSSQSYLDNRDRIVGTVKIRMQTDKTLSQKNKARIKQRLINDINYKIENRARSLINTKKRLLNDLGYLQRNRVQASVNKHKRIAANEQCRKKHSQQASANKRRRLSTDEQCRKKHSQQASANKRRRLSTDEQCRKKHSQQASANKRRRLSTDEQCRMKHNRQTSDYIRARLAVDQHYKQKHNECATKNKLARLHHDPVYKQKHIVAARMRYRKSQIARMSAHTNTKIPHHAFGRLANIKDSQRLLDPRQKYWIRRSRLLADATRQKNLQKKWTKCTRNRTFQDWTLGFCSTRQRRVIGRGSTKS
jgi:hypothetical protein